MRVLIVENDRALGVFLQKGLRLEGHEARWIENGEGATAEARSFQPDLIVLDLDSPETTGTDSLQLLGNSVPEAAVIVLSGHASVDDRILCLNLGADDFISKPFSFHELFARCRAVTRRVHNSAGTVTSFGAITIDVLRRTAAHGRQSLDLTAKEFLLLAFLLRRRGAYCSREELLREVWGSNDFSSSNVIDVHVNSLRRKLQASSTEANETRTQIQTRRGFGYRIFSSAENQLSVEDLSGVAA